ncbi:MAG TPA: FAD binding domain-containing protein [Rectinemataceae bacterium]|nr:FAD binding domain-containing protein [Rectinemataceae bacterium]
MRISEAYHPSSTAEILGLIRANPEIQILAGGTEIVGSQTSRVLEFPSQVASIAKAQELRKTFRTEQFIELGSCTTLTGLLSLAPGTLPEPLFDVIGSIANHAVRNLATIGGNLCCRSRFMDLWPYLACMDAQVELKTVGGTRWASVSHLCDEEGNPYFPKATLLTRVRIPLYSYNFIFFRKLGPVLFPGPDTASFVCMANIDRGKIEDFRMVFAGAKAFRLKDREMSIAGKKTTSAAKEVQAIIDDYMDAFKNQGWFDHRLFLSLLEEAFERLFA